MAPSRQERRRPHDDPLSCTTVFVGFAPFATRGAGLLYRMGLHAIRLDPQEAIRTLGTRISADALVLNLDDPATVHASWRFVELIDLVRSRPRAVAIVAVAPQNVSSELRTALEERDVQIVAPTRLTWRGLGLLLRSALGLATDNHPRVQRLRR